MIIKFELEPDSTEQITPIGVAHALVKCPQFDAYDINELATYLHVYATAALADRPCKGDVCKDDSR